MISADEKATIRQPLYIFATLLLFIISQNADWSQSRLVWWGTVGLFIVAYLIASKGTFCFDSYGLWIGMFFLICTVSFFWALSQALVFTMLKSLVVHVVVFLLLYSSIRNVKDVELLLKLLLLACLVNSVYLIITNAAMLESTAEMGDRLGSDSAWNANTIGMMTALSALIALYFYQQTTNKVIKTLLIVTIAFMIFVSLITGSRKAFVIVLGGISAYLFLIAKGKRIRVVVLIAILILFLFYLIMAIPYFYSIIGWRMEAFLSQFTGKGSLDSSAASRKILIDAAVDAWWKKPIWGHGLDCFRFFGKEATGRNYYAHNNYVELLADIGLVGFVSYYIGYAYVLIQLWKQRAHGKLSYLLFTVLCIIMIVEYACVTYESFLFGVLLLLMFSYVRLNKNRIKG